MTPENYLTHVAMKVRQQWRSRTWVIASCSQWRLVGVRKLAQKASLGKWSSLKKNFQMFLSWSYPTKCNKLLSSPSYGEDDLVWTQNEDTYWRPCCRVILTTYVAVLVAFAQKRPQTFLSWILQPNISTMCRLFLFEIPFCYGVCGHENCLLILWAFN